MCRLLVPGRPLAFLGAKANRPIPYTKQLSHATNKMAEHLTMQADPSNHHKAHSSLKHLITPKIAHPRKGLHLETSHSLSYSCLTLMGPGWGKRGPHVPRSARPKITTSCSQCHQEHHCQTHRRRLPPPKGGTTTTRSNCHHTVHCHSQPVSCKASKMQEAMVQQKELCSKLPSV